MTIYIAVLGLLIAANMAIIARRALHKKFPSASEFSDDGNSDGNIAVMAREARRTIVTAFVAGLFIGIFAAHMGHIKAAPKAPEAHKVHIDQVPGLREFLED